MTIELRDIKSFNGSQNNAFEELICQLAREEQIENRKEFYRVAAPDGGVEAYCVLENGDEYGWQAKYFSSMDDSQWIQLKKSFETSLKTHPRLTKYYVCIPLDRADPRDGKSWFMDKWNAKTLEWIESANKQERKISFEYWGSSEIIHRLSEEKHAGRIRFWFSTEEFSDEWFQSQTENSIKNLGNRYTPELNFELDIAKTFDALSRNQKFREQCKNAFHNFLKEFRKLDSEFLNLDSTRNFISLINNQCELSQKVELSYFNLQSLKDQCKLIDSSLNNYEKNLNSAELSKDSFQAKQFHIDRAFSALDKFQEFISGLILNLANLPVMLLSGEAGIGKSHLLADIAKQRISEDKACILLLGQHFNSEESPWTQILHNLLRVQCNERELLGALNARAEAQGERLLFMIDAINEGKGRNFWDSHISSFIHDFSKYPWLSLVISIRSSYEKLLIPECLISNGNVIKVKHHGFQLVEYQASSFFFRQYGIEQPSIPSLHPEFSNPLFLKLFCEGLKHSNQKQIPKGYSGISAVINFFLNNVDEKLSHSSLFDYQPAASKKIVQKVTNALIGNKLENDLSFITYDSAIDITNAVVSKYSHKYRGFVDALISEGVLSKNTYRINDSYEEGVYFTYERFEDHLAANYLLQKYLDDNNAKTIFRSGELAKYIAKSYQYQGLIEAFSIQLPEQIDKELYELISVEQKSDNSFIEAFVNSLIWRKSETINEKVKEYVNQYVLQDGYTFDLFFQMVYSVASDPTHFFNANCLHRYLMQFSLADRDALWTVYLHDKDFQGSSMQRLIDWALLDEDKSYLSDESRLLASHALAWLFTTTNINFRDSATKALVCILENNIETITNLFISFQEVNDPYVYERICAAAYGAVLRSDNLNGLNELSQHILKSIFEQEDVYPNVLVRDYARNIIEYALHKKFFHLENAEIIRPPYKSQFPTSFPTNEEIDTYKYDYKKSETCYWGQNRILSSMVTEYGRGMCGYGDFGRYTFESAFYDWKYELNANDLSNYACKLIFEQYGYDAKKHGNFDNYASEGDRHTNKKERIGKKYQWLALYEVLARVADNYKMSKGWMDDKEYVWYQGTWESSIRRIDPTTISTFNSKDNLLFDNEWHPEYNDWNGTHEEWLVRSDNLPNPENFIFFTDSQGFDWVILETDFSWNEPVPIGYEQHDYPHKHLWYQLKSYFVNANEANSLISWAKEQHFMGGWLPESHDQHYVFSREYYWSPAYKFFCEDEWEDIYEKNNRKQSINTKVIVTAERHLWESPRRPENELAYLAPRAFMYEKMELQYSKNTGEWLNKQGEVVCFDSSVNTNNDLRLLVRKNALLNFLKENNLKIFWTCLGQKIIYGDAFNEKWRTLPWLELSGVFTLDARKKSGINGSIKPFIQKI